MRGFIQGSLWALIVGGAGLSFASLTGEQPQQFAAGPPTPQLVAPELEAIETPPTVSLTPPAEDTPVFAPATTLEPATDTVEATPDVATEPATPPQTADVATAMETPDTLSEPELNSSVDAPVTSSTGTAMSDASNDTTAPDVDTASVPETPAEEIVVQESVVVEVTPDESAAAPEPDLAEDTPLITILETPAEPTNDIIVSEDPVVTEEALADEVAVETAQTEAPAQEQVEPATNDAVVAENVAEEPTPAPINLAPTEEVVVEETAPEVVEPEAEQPEEEPAVATPAPELDVVEPEIAQTDDAQAETLPQVNSGVQINRPGEDTAEEPQADPLATEETPDDLPALALYAAAFENPNDVPLISILLLDDGAAEGPSAVADLGFLPTVAVDALSPSASETVAAYRAAGLEIAMQIALPSGSQPTDVEVAFEAAFGIVPEAAIFFSDGTGVVQDTRSVTSQVMEILAATGHGFVTIQRGLGTAVRTAAQEGVPAATVLRDLDGVGEDTRAITRALDQAAFRARQSGGAILMGRVTPETLAALRDWAAGLDPEELLIAPVSAVLLDQQE